MNQMKQRTGMIQSKRLNKILSTTHAFAGVLHRQSIVNEFALVKNTNAGEIYPPKQSH